MKLREKRGNIQWWAAPARKKGSTDKVPGTPGKGKALKHEETKVFHFRSHILHRGKNELIFDRVAERLGNLEKFSV